MDIDCIPMVEYFNKHGLSTVQSCQGHNSTTMSMFWIEFASDVTREDIIRFQLEHVESSGDFFSSGRFANRLFMYTNDDGESVPHESWNYFAATSDAANQDLENWKNKDIYRWCKLNAPDSVKDLPTQGMLSIMLPLYKEYNS